MKRVALAALALLLLAGGVVGGYVIHKIRAGRDVRGSSTVEFVTTAAPEEPRAPRAGIVWPMYGYDQRRTRVGPGKLRPPFRKVWAFRGAQSLLEFPPAIAFNRLYLGTNSGDLLAVGVETPAHLSRVPRERPDVPVPVAHEDASFGDQR